LLIRVDVIKFSFTTLVVTGSTVHKSNPLSVSTISIYC